MGDPDPALELLSVLVDLESALASLPEDEQEAYRDAQRSVIEARNAAQRVASTHWVF